MTTTESTAAAASTVRAQHESWLLALTGTPTAAGREDRVIAWIERWAEERPAALLERDRAGNLTIRRRTTVPAPVPGAAHELVLEAHLDHPAFVVERASDGAAGREGLVELSFRGSVRDPYFVDGRIVIHAADGAPRGATVLEATPAQPFRRCIARLDDAGPGVAEGDIATWDVGPARIEGGRLHAPACDDLAAVAAALCAFDVLLEADIATPVRLLFTRAEEIGFIGAIRACRLGTIPEGARIIALENSRSFAESPIGAGPIVRVGDRLSTFDPELTRAVAQTAAALEAEDPTFRWQRRLMPGGACEATAFGAFGHTATCVCLPLGNYHNMGDLERVESEHPAKSAVAAETIAIADFHGLVRLLVACGTHLSMAEPVMVLLDRLERERAFVLGEPVPGAGDPPPHG